MPGSPSSARISSLESLHPAFRARLQRGLVRARAEGLPVFVFETLRSEARQAELYAVGRTEPGRIITKARPGYSWHQYGLAADLAFDGDPETPKVDWSWNGNWARLGEIMVEEGLEWLGAPGSSFTEAPHFQLTAGLSIEYARHLVCGPDGNIERLAIAFDQRLRQLAIEEGT